MKIIAPLFVVFVLYQLVITPLIESIEEQRVKIQNLSSKTFSEQWFDAELKRASDNGAVLQRANTYLETKVVPAKETMYTETGFRKLAENSKLAVKRISSSRSKNGNVYHTTVTLHLEGQYRSFIGYLKDLEKNAPLASVMSFDIRKNKNSYDINSFNIEFIQR